jgi:RNA polymerase sigma-70 factor, ECF subfamily
MGALQRLADRLKGAPKRRALVSPEVIRRARSGDGEALRKLFDQAQAAVVGYCYLACGKDVEHAKDLAQDVFTRVFRSLHTLEDVARFEPWLFTVARNVCVTRGAAEARRNATLRRLELLHASEEAAAGPAPHEREARIALVRELLQRVGDPRLRDIVELKYGEPEHTTREIADRLSIPHGTVTVKLMRFRETIRQELWRALVDEGQT